jgi:hypothetical protein
MKNMVLIKNIIDYLYYINYNFKLLVLMSMYYVCIYIELYNKMVFKTAHILIFILFN